MNLEQTVINKDIIRNLEQLLAFLHKDHQQSLELCWAIREGIRQKIPYKRIKNYTDWYYSNELAPHFAIEYDYIFPILGMENELVKKALTLHRRIKKSFTKKMEIEKSLSRIEEDLEILIRFEEKHIFSLIRNNMPPNQIMVNLKAFSREINNKEWNDLFWQ
ncbi:hemerythrin domain-containing protein [Flavobacterium sp. GT2N3]|uniref:hemerythrin domain-containing protein n=1 Tax=unclassified Flavobacterium TaxID=196869 RepID=UPI003AAE8AB2